MELELDDAGQKSYSLKRCVARVALKVSFPADVGFARLFWCGLRVECAAAETWTRVRDSSLAKQWNNDQHGDDEKDDVDSEDYSSDSNKV